MKPKSNAAAGLFGGAFALVGIAGVGAAQSLITNDTSYAELTYELAYDGTFITFCFTGRCPGPYTNDPGSSAAYSVTAGDARYLFDQTPESWAFETAPADDPDTLFVETRARGDFGVTEPAIVRVTNTFEGSASVTLDGTPVFGEFVTMSPGETLSVSFSSGTAQTVGRELRVEVTDLAVPLAPVGLLGTFGGHTYYLTDEAVDISTARAIAADMAEEFALGFNDGVYLAAIGSVEEDAFLIDAGVESAWIGFSDEVTEGTFVWDNGEPILYTNWEPGQPSNDSGFENYTEMNRAGTGQWNDLRPFILRRAVIEVENAGRACLDNGQLVDPSPGVTPGGNHLVTDLDQNGVPDIVMSPTSGNGVYLIMNGGPASTLIAPGVSGGLADGDFNGDGRTDFVAGPSGLNGVVVFTQQADGTFITGGVPGFGDAFGHPAVADFNGDGHVDLLLVGGLTTDSILVGLNDGTGAFASPIVTPLSYTPGFAPVVDDWDADGNIDVAVWSQDFGRETYVIFGDGDGSFSGEIALGKVARRIIGSKDMDGNGTSDLVVGGGQSVSLILNTGSRTFAPKQEILRFGGANGADTGTIADIDSDGDDDIAVFINFPGTDEFVVLLNSGSGTFEEVSFGRSDRYSNFSLLSAADFDLDGSLDLFASGLQSTVFDNISCPADLNGDCLADLTDIDFFIAAFLIQGTGADLVAPFGIVDLSDVDDFVNGFLFGCQ